jgi:hypothetical protein
MKEIITSTGIKLILDNEQALMLTKYAEKQKLKNHLVVVSDDGKLQNYLLLINNIPNFETTVLEDMAVHIEILSIQQNGNFIV